jgi:hypothetical protein
MNYTLNISGEKIKINNDEYLQISQLLAEKRSGMFYLKRTGEWISLGHVISIKKIENGTIFGEALKLSSKGFYPQNGINVSSSHKNLAERKI